ncbi:MAG: hypothetical protein ACOCRK_01575 [bacterium]
MDRNILFNEIAKELLKQSNKVPATISDLAKLTEGYPDEQINYTSDEKVVKQYDLLASKCSDYIH